MKLEIGDAVKTELRLDGPKIEGTVTGVYPGGTFVEVRFLNRAGKHATAMFKVPGCEKIEAKDGD